MEYSIGAIKSFAVIVFTLVCLLGCQASKPSSAGSSPAASRDGLTNSKRQVDVQSVEWCDLLRDPMKFDSRTIKVSGSMSRFQDYVTFFDRRCIPTHPLINVSLKEPFMDNVTDSESENKLRQIVESSDEAVKGKIHVNVSIVGLLKAIPREENRGEIQYDLFAQEIDQE